MRYMVVVTIHSHTQTKMVNKLHHSFTVVVSTVYYATAKVLFSDRKKNKKREDEEVGTKFQLGEPVK